MTHTEQVQAQLAEYLALPESFPLVQQNRSEMANTLIRQAFKQKERRFHPEPITGFDNLKD